MPPFLLALASAAMTAAAAPAAQAPETFGAWAVACAAPDACQAYLSLKDQKSGRLILSASAHQSVGDRNPALVLTLPLGLSIKGGVALVSGAAGPAPVPAAVDVCFPDGCRVVVDMTPAALAVLTAGEHFEVRFAVYGAGDRVESVKVPANGLKDAIARVSR
jgi:invasion protein IalB